MIEAGDPIAVKLDEVDAVEDMRAAGFDAGDFRLPADRRLVALDNESKFLPVFVSEGFGELVSA